MLRFSRFATMSLVTWIVWGIDGSAAQPPAKSPAEGPSPHRLDRFGDALPQGALTRIGTVRLSHPRATTLAYSPDGKSLVTAGDSGTIRLWDARTGKQLRAFSGAEAKTIILSLAFAPDGKTFAVGDNQGIVRVIDVSSGKNVCRAGRFRAPIVALAYSPDSKLIACPGTKSRACLCDARTGQELRPLAASLQGWQLESIAFSPNGEWVAIKGENELVQVCAVGTGKKIRESKDSSGTQKRPRRKLERRSVAFTSDGTTLAFALSRTDGRILLWDVAKDEVRQTILDGVAGDDCFLGITPDDKLLVQGDGGAGLYLRHLATGKLYWRWEVSQGVVSFALSPDGKSLAALNHEGRVLVLDIATKKEFVLGSRHPSYQRMLLPSVDGRTVLTTDHEEGIQAWDAATGERQSTNFGRESSIQALAQSADGRLLAAAGADGAVRVWDRGSGKLLHRLVGPKKRARCLGFAPQGKKLPVGDGSGQIWLWDLTGDPAGQQLDAHGGAVNSLAFSPDGKWLVSGGEDGRLRIWDANTARPVRTLAQNTTPIHAVAFSVDGRTVAAGGYRDDCVRVWDAVSGRERATLPQKLRGALSLAFSADGDLLASGGAGNVVLLWEVATGHLVQTFTGHEAVIGVVGFFPDGRLASGSRNGTLLIWEQAGGGKPSGPMPELPPQRLDALWDDLADEEPLRAYAAISTLARSPLQSVPFLKKHLSQTSKVSTDSIQRLIAELDDPRFPVRRKAVVELSRVGDLASLALREALKQAPSPEAKRQIQQLLDKAEAQLLTGKQARPFRAIQVLERIGGADAHGVLQRLAEGRPVTRLGQEAGSAVRRMDSLSAGKVKQQKQD